MRLGDVRHIRASRGDVAARQTIHDSRQKQHRDAVSEREHHEAGDRAQQAEDQDRAPAVSVGIVAEDRGGQQLANRVHGEEQPDDERRRAERFGVKRQKRNDDAEADQVDEDGEEDDDEWASHSRVRL